jgi:hypothetical protein
MKTTTTTRRRKPVNPAELALLAMSMPAWADAPRLVWDQEPRPGAGSATSTIRDNGAGNDFGNAPTRRATAATAPWPHNNASGF